MSLSTSTFEPSSLSSSVFTFTSRTTSDSEDDVASLPSSPGSDSFLDRDLSVDSDEESDAEAEWRESLHQLEMLLTMVLVPFVGKFLGRKCAYWGKIAFILEYVEISHFTENVLTEARMGESDGVEIPN
ncbi:conserved hypothetical protein [Trichophyton verrucosum HKI 0517]|uniref:Uncharacterized protein n=1 Tax=Trichophyton verrucosum (strain HKI 0517) TaxID=663202 RepID=D4DK09_TRIVH|nr:uncharacterized protein TRV_07529 [Trichophyton verrucosum HKI 0517]EFE37819.1 conserved hypothetical protein [Trichophyton verrucosum HKI 0517]